MHTWREKGNPNKFILKKWTIENPKKKIQKKIQKILETWNGPPTGWNSQILGAF